MKLARPKARILFSVQSVAGLALLALAVPYSGCFTGRVWNPDTVLIAAKREGRTEFHGNLDDCLLGPAGARAYPGTMGFVDDDGKTETKMGWLIIPADLTAAWHRRLNQNLIPSPFSAPAPMPTRGDEETRIEVDPKPHPDFIGWGYSSSSKFLEAKRFDFKTRTDGFDPEKSGYTPAPVAKAPELPHIPPAGERLTAAVNIEGFVRNGPILAPEVAPETAQNGGRLPEGNTRVLIPRENGERLAPGNGFLIGPDGRAQIISPGRMSPNRTGRFTLVYNPLQRTGWSDGLNATSKVVLTVPAVAGDVVTGAVVVGGAVIVGGVVIVASPFVAAGKAIEKAFEDKPEKKSVEKCEAKPEPAEKSSEATSGPEATGK